MSGFDIGELVRVVLVIALVVLAAALATPRGRLPLALRGVLRILRKDAGVAGTPAAAGRVSLGKRLLAFALVIVAFLLATGSLRAIVI